MMAMTMTMMKAVTLIVSLVHFVDAFKESHRLLLLTREGGGGGGGGGIRTNIQQNHFFVSGGATNSNADNISGNDDGDKTITTNLSQIESLRNLGKSLNPFGNKNNKQRGSTTATTATNDDDKQKQNQHQKKSIYIQSVAAGLAVSLAMVPEAISFAYVAGVSPLVGLWTTVILGFFAASFGGRAGICSSASGACSVVVAALCAQHGPSYLSACAILAGLLQIVFGGYFGMGKFIRLVPHPVMLGFVNGLTVVMARAQLTHFKDSTNALLSLSSSAGRSMYGLTASTAILVRVLPKIKLFKSIPPTLGAVTICSILAKVLKLPGVKTLADVSGSDTFRGGLSVLPSISILPSIPFTIDSLKIVAPYAITMASVGAIESLLTMQLLDNIVDDGKTGSTKKECFGQGIGNVASGITGGIGGCALLGQSVINVQSGGGLSRLSGMSVSLFLALGIVCGAPLLANIPIATLVGVMLTVCQSTFSWSSLRIINKIPKLDALVIFLVSFITVKDDLAKAVVAGVIASALGFAWKQSTGITSTSTTIPSPTSTTTTTTTTATATATATTTEWKSYNINGPLFFGSTTQFIKLFNVKDDPTDIVIDFTNSRVYDHSALEAIHNIADKYDEVGKKVHLRHLSDDCTRLLTTLHGDGKIGSDNDDGSDRRLPYKLIIESDPRTDPVYSIASN
jgi:SulP family sulfate permease